ncbi:MAG: hypothetical protein ACD_28C00116G0001 [uncultured bacterium]|nr:MAG: hypothetical protein ACD_28C00116G0001 [uncultured bacterium]
MSLISRKSLDPTKNILRLVKNIPQFVPNGRPPVNGEAFQPSSEDIQDAETTHEPVRVSVWDLEFTTLCQARGFRGAGEFWPMRLRVSDVHEVKSMFGLTRMDVVSDPLDDSRAGALGHCGIEGLDRLPGESRISHKAAKDELACRATPMEEAARP